MFWFGNANRFLAFDCRVNFGRSLLLSFWEFRNFCISPSTAWVQFNFEDRGRSYALKSVTIDYKKSVYFSMVIQTWMQSGFGWVHRCHTDRDGLVDDDEFFWKRRRTKGHNARLPPKRPVRCPEKRSSKSTREWHEGNDSYQRHINIICVVKAKTAPVYTKCPLISTLNMYANPNPDYVR